MCAFSYHEELKFIFIAGYHLVKSFIIGYLIFFLVWKNSKTQAELLNVSAQQEPCMVSSKQTGHVLLFDFYQIQMKLLRLHFKNMEYYKWRVATSLIVSKVLCLQEFNQKQHASFNKKWPLHLSSYCKIIHTRPHSAPQSVKWPGGKLGARCLRTSGRTCPPGWPSDPRWVCIWQLPGFSPPHCWRCRDEARAPRSAGRCGEPGPEPAGPGDTD